MTDSRITKIVKLISRWLWLSAAMLIIGTVILVVIGRQTISGVDELRPAIQQLISDSTGMQVRLGELQGEWPRLIPIVDIEKVEITSEGQMPAIVLDHGRADLDLFNSLKYLSPIWRELVVDRLAIAMVEDESGRWNLRGLQGGSNTDLDIILEPLFYSRLIRLRLVLIDLEFFSGKNIQVRGDEVTLENDADFHRAELSVRLSDQGIPAYVLVEGQGDPSDLESFHADGYFRLDKFNISKPIVELSQSLLPELFDNLSSFKANASGEVWFDIHPGGSLDFEGSLAVTEIPLDWLADVPPIQNLNTALTGWFTSGSDWGARLQGFDFDWSDAEIEPLDLVFNQRLGSRWQDFDISVNQLDVTVLSDLLRETKIPSAKLLKTIDELRPRGDLSALTLGKNEAGYYASANLDNISMRPYRGVPGVKNINGYLEVQGSGGLFHLADSDGFEVFFPKVYKDYLPVEKAEGTVYVDWQPQKNMLISRSTAMKTTIDAGTSNVMFSVEQPWPPKGRPPEVNLIIGGRDLDAAYIDKYLPYKTPERLSKWLKTAVLAANVQEFGMLVRHSPPRNNITSRTTQLLFKTENTDVDYHPDWLGIRDADVLTLVDDAYVEGVATAGAVGGTKIMQANAVMGDPAVGVNILTVDAQVETGLGEAIDLLAQSPLRDRIGPLASWEYQGDADAQVHLEIPLKKVDGKTIPGNYQISTNLNLGSLTIPNTPISFNRLEGEMHFSTADGLYADAISGEFWQQPLQAKLFKTGGQQKVAVTTEVQPENLNSLVEFPWTKVLTGTIPIEGLLSIGAAADQESPVMLQLVSQMQNSEIRLPQPLGKAANEPRAVDITLHFDPNFNRLEGSIGERLVTDLRFNQTELTHGLVSFDRSVSVPVEGELLIAGYLPTTDLNLWNPVIALFSGRSDKQEPAWKPVFDLKFDYLDLATFKVADIAAQIGLAEEVINIAFTSDLADGNLKLPYSDSLIPDIKLSRLSLPSTLLEQKIGQKGLDPRAFFAVDFSVDSLTVGDKNWGSLAFELRPEVSGAAFNTIVGDVFGLRPGLIEGQPDTEFFWRYDGEKYSSRLIGPVGVDNIGDLFSGLDIPKVMDSKSGSMVFDLSWQDQPWKISKENITGDFQINLQDGSFYTSTGGAGAALKLVSLFNFANWLKRLQLDFSDVTSQNLAYNDLVGTLHFENGVASLLDPLKMKMPSGRMNMAGDFDLVNEQADAQLVATLPVATNLPWVVALLGGVPAAAGVYLTSKLVEKQVDRLSSISYTLSGPFDDIEVAVDKIFAAELKSTEQNRQPSKKETKEQQAE
ncbi:MAG: AsmA-like C-terminal region-containing protein [Porticoccaceae bacterium]|nr:AsmA-like C-terminal region-containing protein [Porticoccaceae bacterium]